MFNVDSTYTKFRKSQQRNYNYSVVLSPILQFNFPVDMEPKQNKKNNQCKINDIFWIIVIEQINILVKLRLINHNVFIHTINVSEVYKKSTNNRENIIYLIVVYG